jgi:hypothetical protein
MTPVDALLARTLYVAVADTVTHGVGSGDMTPDFDEACDRFVDARCEGRAAAVLEISLTDGTAKDVTEAATARVAQWLVDSKRPLPQWMGVA